MKVVLVLTNHSSKRIRPYGRDLLKNAYYSFIKNFKYDFEIVLVDNQSDEILSNDDAILKDSRLHYIYIENQFERGLTGAWNEGIKKAATLDCDIILNSNDDLIFNESINSFVEKINENSFKDLSLFGPLTNGVYHSFRKVQYSTEVDSSKSKEILESNETQGLINGFFFGFTKKFYERLKYEDGDLFAESGKFDQSYIRKYAGGCGKWGGQETEIIRFRENGGKVFLVGDCWIDHLKKRDWAKARQISNDFYLKK